MTKSIKLQAFGKKIVLFIVVFFWEFLWKMVQLSLTINAAQTRNFYMMLKGGGYPCLLRHEEHIIIEATNIDTILVMFNINESISIVPTGSKWSVVVVIWRNLCEEIIFFSYMGSNKNVGGGILVHW